MTALTEDSLEQALLAIQKLQRVENPITLKPTHLLIRPHDMKEVMRLLFYKPPVRLQGRSMRKRKMSKYWRS